MSRTAQAAPGAVGRFRRPGALIQPWLSSVSAFRDSPIDWFWAALSRWKGRTMRLRYRLPSVSLLSLTGEVEFADEPILEGACMPPFCGGKHDDFGALMRIALVRQPNIVLELGTAYGNTVSNICRQCPQVHVYTVNAPPEDISGKLQTYALTREEIGSIYKRYGFSERVTQIYSDTLDMDLSRYFSGPVIDLAIIDACHDPNYVVNDFLKVMPYVRTQGLVLLHDTHPRMLAHLWGSYIGCMELRRRGYDIRHITSTWWGVWQKPQEAVPPRAQGGAF